MSLHKSGKCLRTRNLQRKYYFQFQMTTHPKQTHLKNQIKKISWKRQGKIWSQILEEGVGGKTFAESRLETRVIALLIGRGGGNISRLARWVALFCTFAKYSSLFSHSRDAHHLMPWLRFCEANKQGELFNFWIYDERLIPYDHFCWASAFQWGNQNSFKHFR